MSAIVVTDYYYLQSEECIIHYDQSITSDYIFTIKEIYNIRGGTTSNIITIS